MSKTFEVKLKCPAEDVIKRARKASSENGVRFHGNAKTGHFSGHGIEGHYHIVEDVLSLRVTKKPFVVPWSLIESKFRAFFL